MLQERRVSSTSRILTGLFRAVVAGVSRVHSASRAIISIFCPPTVSMEAICWTSRPTRSGFASKPLTDFHLALPESEAFLKADLSKKAEQLAYAEKAH